MSTTEQLGSLNAPQRKAVTYGEPLPGGKGFRAGPLLIVAGAGTGKTNTLAHRVAHLAMTASIRRASSCSRSRAARPSR